MAWLVEFFVFAGLAAASLYLGYMSAAPRNRITWFTMSFIAWLVTAYQWIVDHPTAPEFMIVVVFLAPIFLCLFNVYEAAWGTSQGKQKYKETLA